MWKHFKSIGFAAVGGAILTIGPSGGSAMLAPEIGPTTWYVDDDAPSDPGPGDCTVSGIETGSSVLPFDAIQEAIDAASDGDTIIVRPGTYSGSCGNWDLDFGGKDIVVRGQNAYTYDHSIDGAGVARAFIFDDGEPPSARVVNLHMKNCTAPNGGAVEIIGSSPTFRNCTFRDNIATDDGGAVRVTAGSSPTFVNCRFDYNEADNGGAIAVFESVLTLSVDTSVDRDAETVSFDNQASQRGGALFFENNSIGHLTTIEFYTNDSGFGGGAINARSSVLNVDSCDFEVNSAVFHGGAIRTNVGSTANVTASSFIWNTADQDGGAIAAKNGSITIDNCVIKENDALGLGGGALLDSNTTTAIVTDTLFDGNEAPVESGGGIASVGGSIEVTGCTFDGNIAQIGGGGLMHDGPPSVVSDCDFLTNAAYLRGGGLLAVDSTDLTVTACDFIDNTVYLVTAPGGGGASFVNSIALVHDCTFDSNNAEIGGGIEAFDGDVTVSNSRFMNHTTAQGGGAFHSGPAAIATYRWCDFSFNAVDAEGGALHFSGMDACVANCRFYSNTAIDGGGAIVARDTATLDLSGSIFSCNAALGMGSGGRGGAVRAVFTPVLNVDNCTFYQNKTAFAGFGGGIELDILPFTADVTNSIFWMNEDGSGMTCTGQLYLTSGFLNVATSDVMDPSGVCPYATGSNFSSDPMFVDPDGPDANCGTLDDDLRLAAGSPCIDAGNNASVPTDCADVDDDGVTGETLPLDLDGGDRISGFVDLGAYEFGTSPCPADTDGSGAVGISDLLAVLANWGPCPAPCPPTCPEDINDDCVVDILDLLALLANWGPC